MKSRKFALGAVIGLVLASSGFAIAQAGNSTSNATIYACIKATDGSIVKLSQTAHACPKGTSPISWNVIGPKGDAGIQGAPGIPGSNGSQGLKGDTGSQGPQGVPGVQGETGAQGPKGDTGSTGGAQIVTDSGVANVKTIGMDTTRGLVNFLLDGNYWTLDLSTGEIKPSVVLGSVSAGTFDKFYLSSDCSGSALYSPSRGSASEFYTGAPIKWYSGETFVNKDSVLGALHQVSTVGSDIRSIYSYDYTYWHYVCTPYPSGVNTGKLFSFDPMSTPDLGTNPRLG